MINTGLQNIKDGEYVFSIAEGWVQAKWTNNKFYPLLAGTIQYSEEGLRFVKDKLPSLYTIDIITFTTKPVRKIDWTKVPVDTPVSVSNVDSYMRTRQLFAVFAPNHRKQFKTWGVNSNTSVTNSQETATILAQWDNCILMCEPKEEWYNEA